jgi:phosphatidylserine decarboxylase
MTAIREILRGLAMQEDLNYLLTNRIPRRALTRLVGRVSRIQNPLVYALGMRLWSAFGNLDLSDAQETEFRSLHACFTRALKPGARPVDGDPATIVSPCDAIIGASGRVSRGLVLQAKGSWYPLQDLLRDPELVARFEGGTYVTLRLTAGMYHRFHAPCDGRLRRVTYFSGDTWNVNPIALARIERLFCRNERAVLEFDGAGDTQLILVPVAAILVASIRLHALDVRLHLRYRGPNVLEPGATYNKGDELGWFEHGSTIIVFAPRDVSLLAGREPGSTVRMGEALLQRAV